MKYDRFSRRMFLQSSGKFMMAVPFLSSLLPREASAQAAAGSVRYVQWITNHGVFPEQFWPGSQWAPNQTFSAPDVKYRALSSITGSISKILGSDFDPVRGKMNLIKGLHGIVNDNWHNACFPTTAANPQWDEGIASFPYSVDSILETSSKVYPTAVGMPALRLTPGVNSNYKWGSYSWTKRNGQPFRHPCYDATTTALAAVFGNTAGGGALIDESVAARSQLADIVYEDYRKISTSKRISAEDKTQINNYMDLVSEVQKRMRAQAPTSCSAPAQEQQTNFDILHKNAIDLSVAAMLCGATKVVAYHCYQGSPTQYEEETFHNWAHNDIANHTKMVQWREKQFARLLRTMDAFTESNGKTLLDNSFVLHSSELSDPGHGGGHLHNMPVITAGSAGGKVTTGNYIDFVKRPYNNLLVTAMQAMGLTTGELERDGVVGFGAYTGYLSKNVGSEYLTDSEKRKPLPFLFKG